MGFVKRCMKALTNHAPASRGLSEYWDAELDYLLNELEMVARSRESRGECVRIPHHVELCYAETALLECRYLKFVCDKFDLSTRLAIAGIAQ